MNSVKLDEATLLWISALGDPLKKIHREPKHTPPLTTGRQKISLGVRKHAETGERARGDGVKVQVERKSRGESKGDCCLGKRDKGR